MVFYPSVYSKQLTRRYRTKMTKRQKQKRGRYGNVSVGKIASDLIKVKKMLNTEHKSIITNYGAINNSSNPNIIYQPGSLIAPTRTVPSIIRIGYPQRGTGNVNRTGSSIKTVSLSSKILTEFLFPGTSDANNNSKRIINPYVVAYLFMRKSGVTPSGNTTPVIGDIFYPDSQGHYTDQCLRRKETLNEYIVLDKKRISAKLNNNLVTTSNNEAFLEEKTCLLAHNKPIYFKWTTNTGGNSVTASYDGCQGPMLFMVFLTNCANTQASESGLTSVTLFSQSTLTFVDN